MWLKFVITGSIPVLLLYELAMMRETKNGEQNIVVDERGRGE